MEKLRSMLRSFKQTVSKAAGHRKRVGIAAAAAVLLLGVGVTAVRHKSSDASDQPESTREGTSQNHDTEDSPDDDDPDPDAAEAAGEDANTDAVDGETEEETAEAEENRLPYGYEGVMNGVFATKGLEEERGLVGTACETVLVGQWIRKTEVVSKLDIGSQMVQVSEQLETKSLELASNTTMSDKDYENLLAIVEAESGGEDIEGRIMVANVILNRVKNDSFPNDVTSVIFDRTGGTAQFSPTEDGRIYNVTVSDQTREAVNRAIDGEDLSQGALYFLAKDGSDSDNITWFEEELVFLFEHGGHSFYGEPS